MKMRQTASRLIPGVLLLIAASTQVATAGTFTYTYTGNDFNQFFGNTSLNTSDFISASFTIAAPLGDNLANANESSGALSWSITDGQTTITPASPDGTADLSLYITTNATGGITEWDIQDTAGDCTVDCTILTTLNFGPSDFFDQSLVCIDNSCGGTDAGNYTTPGVWTSAQVSTPEPSTAALAFLGGTLILLGIRRRKPQHRRRLTPYRERAEALSAIQLAISPRLQK
jgi:hypothetical protein